MKIKELLEELEEIFELDETISIDSELEIDSLDLLSLISFLDEKFGVNKSANELDNISNVRDIINLIGGDKLS